MTEKKRNSDQTITMKNILVICLATIAVVVAMASFILLSRDKSFRSASVFEVHGKSTVMRKDSKYEVVKGMFLESGDKITVSPGDSFMRILLDSDKYILLEPDTEISLIAKGGENNSKTEIKLHRGAITSEIQNKLSDNSTYEVNTPVTNMTVRGTTFRVSSEINEDGEYIVDCSVFEGAVESRILNEDGTVSEEAKLIEGGNSLTMIDREYTYEGEIRYENFPEIVINNLSALVEEGKIVSFSDMQEDTIEPDVISSNSYDIQSDNTGQESKEKQTKKKHSNEKRTEEGSTKPTKNTNSNNNNSGQSSGNNGSSTKPKSEGNAGNQTEAKETIQEPDNQSNIDESSDMNESEGESIEIESDSEVDMKDTTCKVTFDDGTKRTTVKVDYGGYVSKPKAPKKEGHIFEGWYQEKSYQTLWNFSKVRVTSDITLYGKFKAQEYEVTFIDSISNSTISEIKIPYNEMVNKPNDPKRDNYVFEGWYVNRDCTKAFDFKTKIIKSTKVYAKFNSVTFTVSFVNGLDDSTISTLTTKAGEKVSQPEAPTSIPDYDFKGWYHDKNGNHLFDFQQNITKDTKIYAVYEKKHVKITMSYSLLYGGQIIQNEEKYVPIGHRLTASEINKQIDGYALIGWYKDPLGMHYWSFQNNIITEDTNLYALYLRNFYLVSIVDGTDFSTQYSVITLQHGALLSSISPPNVASKTFVGWVDSSGNPMELTGKELTGNMVLYAKYQ